MLSSGSFDFFSSKNKKALAGGGASSSTVVTTRLVTISRPKPLQPKETPAPVLTRTPASVPPPPAPVVTNATSAKKRKRVDEVESTTKEKRAKVEKESLPPRKKKTASTTQSAPTKERVEALKKEHASSPVPQRRARSRSDFGFGTMEGVIPRDCYETRDGVVDAMSCAKIVTDYVKNFKSYFRNLDDPEDKTFEPENLPTVELEYPNDGATERFVLLSPKDKDHYHPIQELMNSLYIIIENYLTDDEALLFGTPPHKQLLPSNFFRSTATSSQASTPTPSSPLRGSSPAIASGVAQVGFSNIDLLRTLSRSHYSKNGPVFVATVRKISVLMKQIKTSRIPEGEEPHGSNPLMQMVKGWGGVPVKVWQTIIEETYQRSVGPCVNQLKVYQAFSSTVYGELTPSFISDITHRTNLRPGKHFMDLGSGVGNVVLQTALQSGCASTGVEILPTPAKLAGVQQIEFLHRCRLWGVTTGETLVCEGDFCELSLVPEKLATADVVLVNNYAYSAELNERLSRLFLDMRDDSIIISLRPFLPAHFRLNEHTANTPLAILAVEEVEYRQGSVSWSGEGGTYYINRIDRSMLRTYETQRSTQRPPRPSRSRK